MAKNPKVRPLTAKESTVEARLKRALPPNRAKKAIKRLSSKRFTLIHLYGGVDLSLVGKAHKTFEKLTEAARKFIKSADYKDGNDNVFYLVTQDHRAPRLGMFDGSDLEEDNEPKKRGWEGGEGFENIHLEMKPGNPPNVRIVRD